MSMPAPRAATQQPVLRAADPGAVRDERDVYEKLLPLQGARIVELGCGAAEKTREIARRHPDADIVALEVDEVQHHANLASEASPNVRFALGGAEAIPFANASFDVVMMFKSLHHVPGELLDRALAEIARVLKRGGLAYISEPIFAGPYNDIIRIFHDEEQVRAGAFAAINRAVESGLVERVSQTFFRAPLQLAGFAAFEHRVINVTHTEHRLSAETKAHVRQQFEQHLVDGVARFDVPMRIDLLRRPI
jgi:ubiquinone/menaquinone biosynthesis C-methylase UbiE